MLYARSRDERSFEVSSMEAAMRAVFYTGFAKPPTIENLPDPTPPPEPAVMYPLNVSASAFEQTKLVSALLTSSPSRRW